MRHLRWVTCLLIVAAAILASTFVPAPTARAEVNAQSDGLLCCGFIIKSSIPFAWLRAEPSPTGRVLTTLYPGDLVVRTIPWELSSALRSSKDGQTWEKVSARNGTISGWIEIDSLLIAPRSRTPRQTGTAAANWNGGAEYIQVRATISYVWLRAFPSSWARPLSTIYGGSDLIIIGYPVADNYQWWWPVRNANNPGQMGWVEQNSLEMPGQTLLPTPIPSPIPTQVYPTLYPTIAMKKSTTWAAYQPFERGFMIWRGDKKRVLIFLNEPNFRQTYWPFEEESYRNWPSPTDTAPANFFTPINAFGKVWKHEREAGEGHHDLGWATAPEQGYNTTIETDWNCDRRGPCGEYYTLPTGKRILASFSSVGWYSDN